MPPRQRMTRAEREELETYQRLHAKYGEQPSRRERRATRDDDDDDDSPVIMISGARAERFIDRIFGGAQGDDDDDEDDEDDEDQGDEGDEEAPADPGPDSPSRYFRSRR